MGSPWDDLSDFDFESESFPLDCESSSVSESSPGAGGSSGEALGEVDLFEDALGCDFASEGGEEGRGAAVTVERVTRRRVRAKKME